MHLIMFSDSSQTINIELKKWHIITLLSGVAIILISFALSTVFIARSYFFHQDTVAKAIQYKHAISQYQIKYEGLYERAYEKDLGTPLPSRFKRSPVAVDDRKVQPASSAAPAKTLKPVDAKGLALAAKAPTSVEREFSVAYSVENLKESEKGLYLKLKIANKDRKSKRNGHIAAVAAYKLKNGDYIYHGWPERIRVHSDTGRILDMRDGTRYNIRSFKFEKMNFLKPLTAKGKFEKVRLFIQEENQAQRVFEIDVKP